MPTAPHPATLSPDALLAQCEVRRLRRSGPGGQHRNKVETAVALVHKPTGVRAEANEQRSQARNQAKALHRLRVRLALEVRAEPNVAASPLWRVRTERGPLRVNPDHEDFPSLLAEAIDQLAGSAWDDRRTAERLGVSRSALLRLLRSEPTALRMLNTQRELAGLPPLV